MRRLRSFLVMGGLALGLLPAPRGAAAETPALVEAGRELFARYCAACHGLNATGNGPVAPVLHVQPPNLTAIAERRGGVFPAGEVASVIDGRFEVAAHGTRAMPVWGRVLGEPIAHGTTADEVSRGRIDALVAYLQSIQRPAAP